MYLIFTRSVGLIDFRGHKTRQNINTAAFFSPSPFFPCCYVSQTFWPNIYEEKTGVIKVEDLPTHAVNCNMQFCGLRFVQLFYPLPSKPKHKENDGSIKKIIALRWKTFSKNAGKKRDPF